MPEAMKKEDKAGAKAAVEYWWQALDYMEQTGNTANFDATSSSDCKFCAYISNSRKELYNERGWMRGTGVSIDSIISRPSAEGYTHTILASFGSGESFDQEGRKIPGTRAEPLEKSPWIIKAIFDERRGHWVISSAVYKGEPSR